MDVSYENTERLSVDTLEDKQEFTQRRTDPEEFHEGSKGIAKCHFISRTGHECDWNLIVRPFRPINISLRAEWVCEFLFMPFFSVNRNV